MSSVKDLQLCPPLDHIITCNKPSTPSTPHPLPPLSISRYNPWWPICQTPKPQNAEQTRLEETGHYGASLNGLTDHLHRRCVCSGPTQAHYSTAIFTQIRNYLSSRRMIVADEQCTCHWRGKVCVWVCVCKWPSHLQLTIQAWCCNMK